MNGRAPIRTVILAAMSAALLFANAASADKPDKEKRKPRQVVDTGVELLPVDQTAEDLLEQMTNRSSEGLTVVRHANGMASVDLEGRFMNVMVATAAPDGSAVFSCQTGAQARRSASAAATVQAWRAKVKAQNAQTLEEK